MNVLIVEDEKVVADNLERLIIEIDNSIKILAKIGTIRDTVKWLQNNEVDLIFLDIHLSDGLSFKIFEQVNIQTPIIFTTAYDKYAIKAFKLNSVDYILKPVEIEKLTISIDKYKQLFKKNIKQDINIASLIETVDNSKNKYKKRFVTSVGSQLKIFNINDIAYFYILDKSVFLKTKNNNISALDYTLNELETLLSPNIFFRINRQFIISISSIKKMFKISKSRIKIELTPSMDEDIFITHKCSNEFKKWLNN